MNQPPENSHPSNNNTSADVDGEIVSIVHQQPQTHEVASVGEAYAVFEPLDPSVAQDRPQWLESLLTPWSLSSLLLILAANSLLSWARWHEPAPQSIDPIPPPATVSEPAKSAIPNSPNSTSDKPVALSLDSLSTTTVPKVAPKRNLSSQSKSQKKVAKAKISNRPKTDLKSALLPPAIQPQFVPVKTIPQPPSPTVLVKTPTPAPVTPPANPVVQLPAQPTSNPSPVDPSTMRTVNERILEEMRLQEEQRQNMPFIEKAKLQKQAIQSRQNLNQALDQMEQQPQQPVIPNTLVIDGQNPANNTNQ